MKGNEPTAPPPPRRCGPLARWRKRSRRLARDNARLKVAVGILLRETTQLRLEAAEAQEAVRELTKEISEINTTIEDLLRVNPRVNVRKPATESGARDGVAASSVSQVGMRRLQGALVTREHSFVE